jgi:hypothetical protein
MYETNPIVIGAANSFSLLPFSTMNDRYTRQLRRAIFERYVPIKDVEEGKFIAVPSNKADSTIGSIFRKQYLPHLSMIEYNVIFSERLVERCLVVELSSKTVEYYHNKWEDLMNNSSEGIGGTYQTLTRKGFVYICDSIRDMLLCNGGAPINRATTFMDIGAGQGRLCWYAATALGCKAIGVEICPHRSSLAAKTALLILRNAERRFPPANLRVAFHCMDATEDANWIDIQIFFLWDTAFTKECVLGIYRNLGKSPQTPPCRMV